MILPPKEDFIKTSSQALSEMYENIKDIKGIKPLKLEEFNSSDTVFIMLDIVNGFVRQGNLKSERVENIIDPVVDLMRQCEDKGIERLCFADCHNKNAVEFDSFPLHCIKGHIESDLVDEIVKEGNYTLICKNSTNGFLEEGFKEWLNNNPNVDNFIISGDCTDICVMQFALTLKAYFNNKDIRTRIIVPIDMVETYSLNEHDGDLMNIVSLQIMKWSGIELVSSIK